MKDIKQIKSKVLMLGKASVLIKGWWGEKCEPVGRKRNGPL